MSNVPNIRSVLGSLIGKRVLDITQHDNRAEESAFVMLMFDDGSYVKFYVGPQGFDCFVDEEGHHLD